jgi:hypothetical protein
VRPRTWVALFRAPLAAASLGVATFTAREATDSTVIFRNPDHDYPQEVGYRRAGADSLIAWVDGTLNGKARRMEFRYARARCSGL